MTAVRAGGISLSSGKISSKNVKYTFGEKANLNHHFVPQFYLRNFSTNGKVIGTFIKARQKAIESAPIKGQCYRVNAYKRQEVEDLLCIIEGQHSAMLRLLMAGSCRGGLTKEQRSAVIDIVSLMRSRNIYEVEKFKKNTGMMIRNLGDVGEFAKQAKKDYDAFDFGLSILALYKDQSQAIYDLGIVLLQNRTIQSFHTSDNPVVTYNLLYEDDKSIGYRGFASTGVLIYMPLSCDLAVLFYDKMIYHLKGINGGTIEIKSEKDMRSLNLLTVVNASECVYFCQGGDRNVKSLNAHVLQTGARRELVYNEFAHASDSLRHMVQMFDTFPNMKVSLSFLTIPKQIKDNRRTLNNGRGGERVVTQREAARHGAGDLFNVMIKQERIPL